MQGDQRNASNHFFQKRTSRGSCASEAPGSRPHSCWPAPPRQSARRVSAGSPGPRCSDGHGVHGPQLLRSSPRGAQKASTALMRRFVKSLLEPVGVVLEDPELCGRLFRGAMHRLVGPRVVGRSGLLKVVAPLAALAGTRGQVLLPPRPCWLPVQRGELIAQVGRDHEVLVVVGTLMQALLRFVLSVS